MILYRITISIKQENSLTDHVTLPLFINRNVKSKIKNCSNSRQILLTSVATHSAGPPKTGGSILKKQGIMAELMCIDNGYPHSYFHAWLTTRAGEKIMVFWDSRIKGNWDSRVKGKFLLHTPQKLTREDYRKIIALCQFWPAKIPSRIMAGRLVCDCQDHFCLLPLHVRHAKLAMQQKRREEVLGIEPSKCGCQQHHCRTCLKNF